MKFKVICKVPNSTRIVGRFNTFEEANDYATMLNNASLTQPYKVLLPLGEKP